MDIRVVQNLHLLIDSMLTYIKDYTVMKEEENLDKDADAEEVKVQNLQNIVTIMVTYIEKYRVMEPRRQEAQKELRQLKEIAEQLGVEWKTQLEQSERGLDQLSRRMSRPDGRQRGERELETGLQNLIAGMLDYITRYTTRKKVDENLEVQDLKDTAAIMLTNIEKYTAMMEDGKQTAQYELWLLKEKAKHLGVEWKTEEQRRRGNLENEILGVCLPDGSQEGTPKELRRRKLLLKGQSKAAEFGSKGPSLQDLIPVLRYLMTARIAVIAGIVLVIALSGIILARWPAPYFGQDSRTQGEALRVFTNSFDELQASFPQQTPRFWRILRNRATAHLKNPKPEKPLVFMFTAPPSAHNVLGCLARKFAQSLDYENGKRVIESIDYTRYSSLDDAKNKLDDNLKEILQKGHNLLVLDVDKLPVQSPLLFYEYCDNENAPYKHAAIIFTVRLPSEPDPSLEPAKKEGLVAEYLREFWGKQDYRMDDIPPLVARMTDTVVMVKKESKEVVKRNCDT